MSALINDWEKALSKEFKKPYYLKLYNNFGKMQVEQEL